MTERLKRFHNFKSAEELLEYRDNLPEEQKIKMEETWNDYFDLREKGLEIKAEAEKRFQEVWNPILALNTFALIEGFKGNARLGIAAHAIADVLLVKAAIDRTRKITSVGLNELRKLDEALREDGIAIRGVKDLFNLVRIYRDSRSVEHEENIS